MTGLTIRFVGILMGLVISTGVQAQSTVAELLEKGGKQITKADFMELIPMRVQMKWPVGSGEEELFFSADGKITGTGHHYPSKSDSPAEGTWTIEDDGKFCTPKRFTAWGTRSNLCWYGFRLGASVFGTLKTDPDSKLFKTNSVGKIGG